VIQKVGSDALRIYLYHIPAVSLISIGAELIERLLNVYPTTIAGIKDSSGDWRYARELLGRFQPREFDIFAGNENFLLNTMRAGGAGCITATGNVNPAAIVDLYRNWECPDADKKQGSKKQGSLDATRARFSQFPMIPALKAAIGLYSDDQSWRIVRPPLVGLTIEQADALRVSFVRLGIFHAQHLRCS